MTPTQKRFAEFPLLFLIIWVFQALEISVLQLPFNLGSVHFIPVLVAYVALTRDWYHLAGLTLLFSIMGSFTVGYPMGIYISVQIWAALTARIIVSEFALEGRRPFTMMAIGNHFISKILCWVLLNYFGRAMPLGDSLASLLMTSPIVGLLAWLIFPLFLKWDEYFEHPVHESRDLNPGMLR